MESTCIAVEERVEDGEKVIKVKAYGDKARALNGRSAINTHIVNPVCEGDIVNEDLAVILLSHFLEKIEITLRGARKVEALFILPCGSKSELKEKYKRVAEKCGLGDVLFTYTPFAAVLGHNMALSESTPVFCIDIGYGITNIAAISQDGIISGINVNLGGGNIDVHIMDELAENNNLKIGSLTAEKLKNNVGSLLADDNKMVVVDGREANGNSALSLAVNSSMLYPIITTYIDKIIEYALLLVNKLPAEVASGIMRGGVYLSGGLLKMDGLADYIGEKLKIPVILSDEPQLAVVMGAGAILSSITLSEKLTIE
jgi:rod shape-determining protein MreB